MRLNGVGALSYFTVSLNLSESHKVRIGSCAWSYPGWSGVFYPAELPTSEWLEWYSRYFVTVEIDATFYATPAPETVARWLEATPANFRFSCKLPREITHQCRLHDCSAQLTAFMEAIEPLAPKLRSILVQLPPSFSPKDGRAALRSFLKQLPREFRFALEFRHQGWHRPEIIRLLERHRVCWVWADTSPLDERNLAPFEFQPSTTDFLYVRLLGDYATKYDGDGKQMHQYGRLLWKREAALESWALKIERQLADVRAAYIYANNHFEGFAPETCQRLAERFGFELTLPAETELAAASADPGQLELL
ncbi:MAG: DUF72 domain-containing protein [Verrucomicrobia bacterium]|nr:DUF72 domain-containing protein [Verrucomicrobiota bacterium]